MTQVINTNVASLNSQRQLNKSQSALNTSLERLSSGLRINSAKDDAAGLAISQRMTSQINGMNQAVRNANDGISMSQTAEAALATAGDLLTRIRELAVQSSNASNTASDRQAIQSEVGQLTSELDRISTSTQFNGQNLLDGTAGTLNYQVGANANQTISASGTNFRTSAYGDNQSAKTAITPTAAAATATSNVVGSQAITVSGYLGSEAYTTQTGDTAKTIAAGVNSITANTGVTATAVTTASLDLGAEDYSFAIISDNAAADAVTVSFSVGGTASTADDYSSAISSINAQSSKTGVTAEFDKTNKTLKLTNASGNDIQINQGATANTAFTVQSYAADGTTLVASGSTPTAANNQTIVNGRVTFDSQQSFSITDAGSGLALSDTSTLKSVASLDVTTYENAQLAIKIVDSALAAVNNQRAQYGAMQNRFTSVVSNLQSSSENLSASRSRIQDADFAAETAAMSKANILQQAGTAMLAQANSAPQNVLSLLK